MKKKVYILIAGALSNIHTVEGGACFVFDSDLLPSGAGIDNGNKIYAENCTKDQIVICSSWHKINDQGFYDGWIDFRIVVKPDFINGFTLSIFGKVPKDIKDYLLELYSDYLNEEIEYKINLTGVLRNA